MSDWEAKRTGEPKEQKAKQKKKRFVARASQALCAYPPPPPLSAYIQGGTMGREIRPQSAYAGSPGPADYPQIPSSPIGAGRFGRAGRTQPSANDGMPGPADYDSHTEYTRPQSARAVIGSATRSALSPKNASAEVPIYAPTFEFIQPISPRQPIGRAERFPAQSDCETPGPGAFTLPRSPSGPAYTIRAR